jgi:hypothetical protein
MRRKCLFLFPLILLCLSVYAGAQAWSGILDPSRAVDWTKAGVVGGIPNRTTVCATLNPGATASQITNAIAACPANQVVFLNAGTYNLSGGIDFQNKSNITLRGAGADQTLLVFNGNIGCRGPTGTICIASASNPMLPSPANVVSWTAGFAQGTNTITVSNASGINVGTTIIMDRTDDSADTGTIFICSSTNCTSNGGGNAQRPGRGQEQFSLVTAKNGNTLTISPAVAMPNWNAGSPQVMWANGQTTNDGVENLSIDNTNSGGQSGVIMLYVYNCWVKGIRSVTSNRNHIWVYQSSNLTIRDSYIYGALNAQSESYGIETFSSGSLLIENNIIQHVAGSITVNGADSGSVYSYNFNLDQYYLVSPGWMIADLGSHEVGISYNLYEGNSGLAFQGDNVHGTHHFLTAFRNHLYGDIWNNPPKSANTTVAHIWTYNRYFNVVGNVLGRSPYYNTYETNLSGSGSAIFSLGDTEGPAPTDPLVKTTLLRWGNYDTVTGTSRFLTSEVPSGLSLYSNAVPANNNLPASFYLSGKPTWWGSMPWPAIGPDVSGGNGPGGHSYMIPAENCWYNVMHGVLGSGGALSFNASNCYSGGSSGGNPPAPPTGLSAVVQ